MKFYLLSVALLVTIALAKKEKADKTFLKKQQSILKLTWRLSQANDDVEQAEISQNYNPLDNLTSYSNPDTVQTLFEAVNSGEYKARGEIFNLFAEEDRKQAVELFEVLHFAKEWDLFYKTAVFARDRVNEGQFYYAFMTAVLHRNEGFVLPPPYEVFPHLFTNSDVIRQAYKAKMTQTPTIIPMNFTGTIRNPEQRVSYFGEDIGLNAHHSHWHADFPFWWDSDKYGGPKDRQGELFWYTHHQLTVRFDAERLSNGLQEVEELQWDKPILEGFVPKATYKNGQEFPSRPDNMIFQDLPHITVTDMKHYELRIRDGIAAGFLKDKEHNAISLNNSDGIDILGKAMESSADSINPNYYGSIHNMAHVFLSKVTDPKNKYGLAPGVMEHFETATRDPAFFRLHKYMDFLFKEHKDYLVPYTREEIDFPGVRVDRFEVKTIIDKADRNNLVTYFDTDHIDLANAMDTSETAKDVEIKAQVSRLTHIPFNYEIEVSANSAATAVARVFLMVKNNWYGEEMKIEEAGWGAMELDKFSVKLFSGLNTINRSSVESSVVLNERKGYKQLLAAVEDALEDRGEYFVDKQQRHCGLPRGLLIPKGTSEGMAFRLFVIFTDYEKDIHADSFKSGRDSPHSYCGILGDKYPDKRPLGFPFDRKIQSWELFETENMKDIEITIKHKSLSKVDFSPEEISQIKSTWSVIRSDPTGNGVTLYLNWFQSLPETQKQFKRFSNITREQLSTNEAFRTQATATITRLDDIISSIDHPTEFCTKMKKLAGDHKFRDANTKNFRDMTNIFVEVIRKLTGKTLFTPAANSGWKKVFARLIEKIEEETSFTHGHIAKVQLTPDEMIAIKRNWEVIHQDLTGNGMDMYLHWFAAFPHMQKVFKKFAQVPRDQLKTNDAFKAQATVTLHWIDDMIEAIDSPSDMAAVMKRLGRMHQTRHTNIYDFREMVKRIQEVIGTKVGEGYTPAAESGWTKLFAKLVENIGDGLSEKH